MSRGVGTPSRDLTSVVLFSSRMMSLHSSTHSSQMNTVGPAISLRTSCCDLPQKLQYRVLLLSDPLSFVMLSSNVPGGTATARRPRIRLPNVTRKGAISIASILIPPACASLKGQGCQNATVPGPEVPCPG